MVLAAGLGTRLRPLTLERPKPGVPYGLAPLACVSLEALAAVGVREVVMNTHHLGERLPGLLEPHLPAGMSVRYLHEETLLGTGGGVANAAGWLREADGPVLLLNSDIVFRPDLGAALETHRRLGARATMVLRPDPAAERLGAIDVDPDGRVRRLLGEPAWAGETARFMFTGVHVLSADALDDMPPEGCIVRHAYRRWVDDPETVVAGVVDEGPWRDLGTLAAYLGAQVELARAEGGALGHPSAEVDPAAELDGCVVGAGARIGPVRLARCVVWPGARVIESLEDAVVTPERVVTVGA